MRRSSHGFHSASLGIIIAIACATARAETVSFRNDVMAVLSKAGCNQGVCHGNRSGKGGFKLSLRGQEPDLDYVALTRDVSGRRVNPVEPDKSLIILKPTLGVPHEGGRRFEPGSEELTIILRWLAAGMPADSPGSPIVAHIEVEPTSKIVVEPDRTVQARVEAIFSDGARRDVTTLAVYEATSSTATVRRDGLIERASFGETTVLVRFLQCQVPLRVAFVPERPGFAWKDVPPANYIDEHVFARLKALRTQPSEPAPDSVFVRRVFLDALGILPTSDEAREFCADRRPDKRERLIDRLLERPELAEWWALKWSDLLRNEERALDVKGVETFHNWIRGSLESRKPLDRFVRELLTARGSTYKSPAANYYRACRDPVTRAESAAQVFLGLRLQCAKCHNHPFDRWTQDDYYGWASFFARVDYKVLENRRHDKNDGHEFIGEQIVWMRPEGEVTNARTGRLEPPRLLGAGPLEPAGSEDRLERLAEWITSRRNPFFARAQANRIWYHLIGRGIVEPVDDFRATNPPSNPALLDALAADFAASGFDLRHLIRVILTSRTYQLSAVPNETNAGDETGFARAIVRRLSAEQLHDACCEVTGVPPAFSGYPQGFRAGQLPGVGAARARGAKPTMGEQFLASFGKPPRLLACECERSGETTMGQAFQLVSGPLVNDLLTHQDNRLARLLASGKLNADVVDELYWAALARPPSSAELAASVSHLEASSDRREALEDIAWSLLNAKEFLLRS